MRRHKAIAEQASWREKPKRWRSSRPAEHVLADVREGYVSLEAAERGYGVVLTADENEVDVAATSKKRAAATVAKTKQ